MQPKIGSTRLHFNQIDSTHRYLMNRGKVLSHGTVITAEYQSEGRGRSGRTWEAPERSSFLCSMLVKPDVNPADAAQLIHIHALACSRALSKLGLETRIRWPNDLMKNNKKLGGLLAELDLSSEGVTFVVLSAGINLNQDSDMLARIDRPATSCFVETGRRWDPSAVLEKLLDELELLYRRFCEQGFSTMKEEWEALNMLTGKIITLDLGKHKVQGSVIGFGGRGEILVNESDGIKSVCAGEVIRVLGEQQ